MTLSKLKFWRFVIPAGLILVYTKALGWIIGWWDTTLPDFSKAPYLPVVLIPAALYYITPLRHYVNSPHHSRIAENLRAGLVRITSYQDKPERYTWNNLRSLFFKLVDSDTSLTKKADLAYVNGLLWTSFADSTAISLLYLCASIALYLIGVPGSSLAIGLFVAICVISEIGSRVTTRKQISIGNEQLEVIRFEYVHAVEERLNKLDS